MYPISLQYDMASNYKLERKSKQPLRDQVIGWCDACGTRSYFEYVPVINSQLSGQWDMSTQQRELMSCRESMHCLFCSSSYRLRLLARAVQYIVSGDPVHGLERSINLGQFNRVRVAEINSCGVLHDILRNIPKLSYSEYASTNPDIPHQDLENLTYKDNSFDLVLTSDVLEHVPDVRRALAETFRVLRPGGAHIMSVPLLMDRKTRNRTRMIDGKPKHTLPASYHGSGESDYLVWSEFGYDFVDICREVGFEAYFVFQNPKNRNDISGVIVALKPGVNKILTTSLPAVDTVEDDTPAWGDQKLSGLANKIHLTSKHVSNLQELLDEYVQENSKKQAYIDHLEARGAGYYLKNTIKRVSGRRSHRQ